MTEKAKTEEGKTVAPAVEKEQPIVKEVASRASKDADQGTSKIVNLEETTGKLWGEQQEQYAEIMKAQDPTYKATQAFEELHEILERSGSVLFDPEAKKAALEGGDKVATEKSTKAEAKAAAERDARVEELTVGALEAERAGNVLYDAEAKKAALIGGEQAPKKAAKKADKSED